MNFKNAIRNLFFKDIFGGKHTRKSCLDEAVESALKHDCFGKQHKHDEKSCINCNFNAGGLKNFPDVCCNCTIYGVPPAPTQWQPINKEVE